MSQGIMTANQYSMVPYIASGEHGSVDVGQSPAQYMMVPSNQTVFETTPANRAQQSPNLTVAPASYQLLDQQEAQQPQHTDEGTTSDEQNMQEYERELRRVFDAILAGRVSEAAEKLLEVSRWLLSSVEQLSKSYVYTPFRQKSFHCPIQHAYSNLGTNIELHHDNEALHDQRVLLWREFNHAWEALGQKQKNIARQMLTLRHRPANTDTLTASDVVRIMNEFVALCDKVEPFALVDYELGVWEEQIVGVFILCLDLLSQYESLTGQEEVASQPR